MKAKLAEAIKILLPLIRECKAESQMETRTLLAYAARLLTEAGDFSFDERKALLLETGADPELVEAAATVAKAQENMTKLAKAKAGDADKKDDETLN